jgi:hypothetical protein
MWKIFFDIQGAITKSIYPQLSDNEKNIYYIILSE